MTFESHLASAQARINRILSDSIDTLDDDAPRLKEAMHYALLNGGKRVRPFLAYTTGDMLGVSQHDLDVVAAAIECIHTYSLVHDDLPAMDDDDLRRGKPTCHKAFDEATAILVGDALQTLAFELLSTSPMECDDSTRITLLSLLAGASGYSGMCGGQAMDIAATSQTVSEAHLALLHQKKTGALLKASVIMPMALVPSLPDEHRLALETFAQSLGLAFQVRDDILDVIGDSETLGKPQGSDLALNKSTYPALLGLDGAKALLEQLQQQALQAIRTLPYNTQVLQSFADYIVNRNH